MDKTTAENPTQFSSYIERENDQEEGSWDSAQVSPFDKGYYMAWMCPGEDGQYNYDARAAIEYFERKYKRVARQIAIGVKCDIGIDVADFKPPEGQIWVR